jgi:DNA-binding LacI/PurR family transcriptional regulator
MEQRRDVVTSLDVARHAGVSQSSVSLVLSGKDSGRVSADTADRIRTSARELGYQLIASARNLKTGRAEALALAVPNVDQPYFARVLLGAERVARTNGYTVTLLDSSGDHPWAESLIHMIRGRQLDGAIVYAPTADELEVLADILSSLVLVEPESAAPGAAAVVDLGIEDGAQQAVGHLMALGHQRAAHFGASYPRGTFRRRRAAFLETAERLGGTMTPTRITATFDLDEASAAADRLLDQLDGATAVLCDDDLLAAALVRVCRRRGIRVPQDLSVVGFGDIPLSRYVTPELTTVGLPAQAVGETAVTVLLAALREGSAGVRSPLSLPLELVVRASTGPAPRS